jgi:hypothetical protein
MSRRASPPPFSQNYNINHGYFGNLISSSEGFFFLLASLQIPRPTNSRPTMAPVRGEPPASPYHPIYPQKLCNHGFDHGFHTG